MKKRFLVLIAVLLIFTMMTAVHADGETVPAAAGTDVPTTAEAADPAGTKAMAAAIVVGIVAAAGAIGMALAISKSAEGMARQPEIAAKINSAMMLGLVFIETAIIYALIVAILIIFVL